MLDAVVIALGEQTFDGAGMASTSLSRIAVAATFDVRSMANDADNGEGKRTFHLNDIRSS